MNYSLACSHPLQIAWTDFTTMSFEVLMVKYTLLHIGNGLEASMWMVWECSRKSNFEVIKHKERI